MDLQWMNETCGTCVFACGLQNKWDGGMLAGTLGNCRKNPPNWHADDESGIPIMMYPEVMTTTEACSCWRQRP